MKALFWGLIAALYIGFGLEPTAWLFYELSHLLNIDWIYWGYSAFRGLDFALGLYGYQLLASVLVGIIVCGIVSFVAHRSGSESKV